MEKLLSVLLVVSSVLVLCAERQPYERYETIVDRQMFGPPPPGFDPTKMPSEVSASRERGAEKELTREQEQLKSAIRFSVINVARDGRVEVGFTDNSDPKAPRHYFLKVGDSRDGWTVKEADAEKATMTVVKNEIEISLTLGGDSSKGGTKGAAHTTAPSQSARSPLVATGGVSLRQRRREREAQEHQDALRRAQEAKDREEEKQKLEQERANQAVEREEQRKQLMQIQEELRQAREAREAREAEARNAENGDETQ